MTNKSILPTLGLSLLVLAGVIVLSSCEETPVLGTVAPSWRADMGPGIPAEDMRWIPWQSEVIQKIQTPDVATRGDDDDDEDDDEESGTETELVTPGRGGTVGGDDTFGNTVTIPRRAMKHADWITVKVACVDDDDQCGAGVDFLPSMTFKDFVTVTLSWEFVDTDDDGEMGLDFKVYFSEDGGETWYEVPGVYVDYEERTVSVEVDHFTRFAWAL